MTKSDDKPPRKPWEDLVVGAFERLAAAPGKLKDPAAAFDWLKGIRDDIQSKVTSELSQQLKNVDWTQIGKAMGDHLAENYDIKVTAEISLKPKKHKSDEET